MEGNNIKKVTLAYFSGTGCTKMIVDCFEKQFVELGIAVNKINIPFNSKPAVIDADLLIIFSPVYAFRLTSIVEEWTRDLPEAKNMSAAVISVSGGGEVSPNTACRIRCKQYLKKKGYELIYEEMFVMPSNFAVQAERQLNVRLIQVIPAKVNHIITDILSGRRHMIRPQLQDRCLAVFGKAEHLGAKFFGASIRVSKDCNQCGLCIKGCPKNNIRMKKGELTFGFQCMFCLKCLYTCPRKALTPGMLKFAVLKDGFDMKALSREADDYVQESADKSGTSKLWDGVTRYLDE